VRPGVILTPLHERRRARRSCGVLAPVPLGRGRHQRGNAFGAYLYLASETLSSYVTGQIIEVNGGVLTP